LGFQVEKDNTKGAVVFIIDGEASVRSALQELFESVGLEAKTYVSAADFLEDRVPETTTSCLVLDVRLPGMSGLKFQEELTRADVQTPIIFITAHGDIPMAVHAIKAGAVDFLTKPFRSQDVLDAAFEALERDRIRREKEASNSALQNRFATLTLREREVIARVAAGDLNKQIAAKLELSEVTVKVHRANAMRKMRAKSLAEMIRMIGLLGMTNGKAEPGTN
jgi:FixJ family two-component response regulator